MKTHVAIQKILKSINIHQDYHIWKKSICALCQPIRKGSTEWMENGSVDKKMSVDKKIWVCWARLWVWSVECGVWSVECDNAISGEPPFPPHPCPDTSCQNMFLPSPGQASITWPCLCIYSIFRLHSLSFLSCHLFWCWGMHYRSFSLSFSPDDMYIDLFSII